MDLRLFVAGCSGEMDVVFGQPHRVEGLAQVVGAGVGAMATTTEPCGAARATRSGCSHRESGGRPQRDALLRPGAGARWCRPRRWGCAGNGPRWSGRRPWPLGFGPGVAHAVHQDLAGVPAAVRGAVGVGTDDFQMPARPSCHRSFRNRPLPLMVPPVPMPATKCVTMPPVCSQISGAGGFVVRRRDWPGCRTACGRHAPGVSAVIRAATARRSPATPTARSSPSRSRGRRSCAARRASPAEIVSPVTTTTGCPVRCPISASPIPVFPEVLSTMVAPGLQLPADAQPPGPCSGLCGP